VTLVIRPLGGRRKEGKIVYKYVEEEEEEEKEVVPLKRLNYYYVDIFFYFFSHFLSFFFCFFPLRFALFRPNRNCRLAEKNSNTTRKEKKKQNAAVSFPPISHNQPFFFTIVVFPQHLERKNELTD
jgi:hypothetical protein